MEYECKYEGKIAEIHTEVKNLKESFNQFKENDFHEIKKDLKRITDKMAKPRLPLWVTVIFTFCSALITGLIIVLVK